MPGCDICFYIILLIIIALLLYLLRRWLDGGTCHSNVRLDGKTVVITGANTGIGKETAIDLAKRGAIVIMACRDEHRGESAVKDVMDQSGSNTVFLKVLDLSLLRSISEFTESFLREYTKLHILVNNAGVFACPYIKTEDGFEMQMGVNHFGHFALTNLLLERIIESAPSRIVNVSSNAHQWSGNINFDDINSVKSYSRFGAYGQSKLANILFTKELHQKIAHTGVATYSLHPGAIKTELGRHFGFLQFFFFFLRFLVKSPEQGAQTTIYCAVEEGIENQSGMYFSDCTLTESSLKSCDEGMAKKLWEVSEEMTGIKFPL